MSFSVSYKFLAIDKFTAVTKKMSNAANKFNSTINNTAQKMKKVSSNMTSVGQSMTLKLSAPILSTTLAFKEFEDGLTNVLTLMSPADINKFSGSLQNMQENAVKAGFSISDASKALFDTVSALGTSEKSFKTFEIAQKLAIGGVTDLSVSVDGLTSVVNAYGKETTNASDVANAFFSAQRAGKTTVAELAANVGKVAPIAKTAGVGFKELLAAMSQLTLGGLSTDEATTALRGTLTSLIKPGAQAQKILKALGVPFGATAIQANGLGNVLAKLTKASEKYPDAIAQAIPNIRAFTAVSAFGAKELKNMDSIVRSINKDIKNGTGLNDAYAMQLKTFSQSLGQITGKIKIMAKNIAKDLIPIIIKIFSFTGKLIDKFNNLSPSTKKIISVVLGLVAVLGPLLVALGAVVKVGAFIVSAFGAIGGAFSIVGGIVSGLTAAFGSIMGVVTALGGTLLAVLGPVGLIIAAVGALVAAGIALWKNWDKVVNVFRNVKSTISGAISSVKGFLGFGDSASSPSIGNGSAVQQAVTNKNMFQGNLDINLKDKGNSVESVGIKNKGFLNVGFNQVGVSGNI